MTSLRRYGTSLLAPGFAALAIDDACCCEPPDPCAGHDTCADCPDKLIVTLDGFVPAGHWPNGCCACFNGVWTLTRTIPLSPFPCGWHYEQTDPVFWIHLLCDNNRWEVGVNSGSGDFPVFASATACNCNVNSSKGCPVLGAYTMFTGCGGCDCSGGNPTCSVSLP